MFYVAISNISMYGVPQQLCNNTNFFLPDQICMTHTGFAGLVILTFC